MKSKVCTKCQEEKELFAFHKDRSKSDGYRPDCKECTYNNIKQYPWKFILKSIKQRCNNHNAENYKWYGEKGIECKITEKEIKFLWFRDKAYNMEKPSIDRKNSNKNYILSNCRFIEFKENLSRQDRTKSFKSVLQYDLKDKFIREFKNIIQASKHVNTSPCNISDVLHKRHITAKGFKWRYKYAQKS